VDIVGLTQGFDLAILGDIHMPYRPTPNSIYTTSPSQTEYKLYKPNQHGYVQVTDGVPTFIPLDLPRREKVLIESVDQIPASDSTPHLYKYVLEETDRKFLKSKVKLLPNQTLEVTFKTKEVDDQIDDKLKEFMRAKLSVEDVLFETLGAIEGIDHKALNSVRRQLK
jgi:hypothetical protein